MGELASQWYQAGSLLVQAGFLAAAVWSVRAILKNMRASREQMGALLKLTVAGVASSGEAPQTVARPTPYLLDGWPEATPNSTPEISPTLSSRPRTNIFSGVTVWLQAPMVSSGISPWRRAMRWLQAPAGS